jgi:hypothetical protein
MLAKRFPTTLLQFALALCLLSAIGQSPQASAQTFHKTFSVAPDASEIELINQTGSIKITAASANRVTVSAKQNGAGGQISAVQTPEGRVKIEVTGLAAVEFELSVPPESKLDLLCYKCAITVANLIGPVRARATDGNILFTGLRSPHVEAHSTSGDVTFTGEILPSGSYTLKSFSGRVDVTLPAQADFTLSASSFRAGMDLGGYPLKFQKQSANLIEATAGAGRAAITLWTQEGSLHLHHKP